MLSKLMSIFRQLIENLTTTEKCNCLNHPKLQPLDGKIIVLDPGHGLYRKSTNGNGPLVYQRPEVEGIREDLITIKMAKYLAAELEALDAGVMTTRGYTTNEGSLIYLQNQGSLKDIKPSGTSNKNKDVNVRWQYANKIHGIMNIDLFLSIHFNAGGGHGCETFYYKGNEETKKIAEAVQAATIKANKGLRDRGVKETKSYAVVKKTKCPAILWEGAFFDNEGDRETFLKDEDFYKRTAKAIAQSLISVIGNKNNAQV